MSVLGHKFILDHESILGDKFISGHKFITLSSETLVELRDFGRV